jgi:hypothetical protein
LDAGRRDLEEAHVGFVGRATVDRLSGEERCRLLAS